MSSQGSSQADSYQLVRCLRTTEASETHEAVHPSRPGRFLVEVITSPAEAGALEGFERELATLAEAGSPNILHVVGLGQLPDGRTAAIWDLPGGTLTQWFHRGGAVSADAAIELVAGVAKGLEAAHARGIAHGSVSADNVFLSDGGEGGLGAVKVGGFGLRWLGNERPGSVAGSRPDISADLAGLAEIAEHLLAPLELSPEPSARSRKNVPTPSALIERSRGEGSGRLFASAVEFSEALSRSVRTHLPEVSEPAFDTAEEEAAGERESEAPRPGRLGRVVARVGVATLATVVTVVIVGMLADPDSGKDPPRVVMKPAAPVVTPQTEPSPAPPAKPLAVPQPPAEPEVPAPAAAPPPAQPQPRMQAQAPAEQASAKPARPSVVTIQPPERKSSPRARRGLVWSNRLQRLVTVDELKAEQAKPPPSR